MGALILRPPSLSRVSEDLPDEATTRCPHPGGTVALPLTSRPLRELAHRKHRGRGDLRGSSLGTGDNALLGLKPLRVDVEHPQSPPRASRDALTHQRNLRPQRPLRGGFLARHMLTRSRESVRCVRGPWGGSGSQDTRIWPRAEKERPG